MHYIVWVNQYIVDTAPNHLNEQVDIIKYVYIFIGSLSGYQ